MARRCALLGTGVQSGNNVSHSKRHTRRRFLPNLHEVTFRSDFIGSIKLRVTAATIRTVEHNGGIDSFLLSTSSRKLTDEATKLKRKVKKKASAATEQAAA